MNMKTFDLEKYGTLHKIQLSVTTYHNGGGLAIVMTDWTSGEAEPWNVLTVNLDSVCPKDCAYIDTNNNGEEIVIWILLHELAVPTGRYGYSGFCRYPEYRFLPEILQELDPDGYSAYLQGYEKKYDKKASAISMEKAVCPSPGTPALTPSCTFGEIFQETHEVDGHTARLPVSEIAYSRSDYDGRRWWTTWFPSQKESPAAHLAEEIDGFHNALFEMPEFESLASMEQLCQSAEATADSGEYNLYSETEHFHIWLRMITRPRDYNLYVHYYRK